ncbi:hypothetical protein CTZ27_27180 [Streptomyces griseocarneus]|nr:hypothetical protein CTZ27_27180 [Streptomyces griseocarneus]
MAVREKPRQSTRSVREARIASLQAAVKLAASVIEGFKIEAVGDRVIMTPQSSVQSLTIFEVQLAVRASGIARKRVLSDVEVTFPGEPERCPDVSIIEDGATEPLSHEALLAAIEIVSSKNDKNDYAVKTWQYAHFGVPVYLIIDPFRGECDLLTEPRDDAYASRRTYKYGDTITFTLADGTEVEIPTDAFDRRK